MVAMIHEFPVGGNNQKASIGKKLLDSLDGRNFITV